MSENTLAELAAFGLAIFADCPGCRHRAPLPLAELAARAPSATLARLRASLRCQACGARGACVALAYVRPADRPAPAPRPE